MQNLIQKHLSYATLDWPWIAEWAYAGIFTVAVRIQNQDQFWISHQKIRGRFFIFSKSKKRARTAKNDVFGNFSENSIVFR